MYRFASSWLFLTLGLILVRRATANVPITRPVALVRPRQTPSTTASATVPADSGIISVDSTTISVGSFAADQFCTGVGGICDLYDQLLGDCDAFLDTQFYECICGNGAVSAHLQ